MIKTLFQKEMRSNLLLLLLFCFILSIYCTMIVFMYDPDFSSSLHTMIESMPEVFSAFGMQGMPTTLIEFLVNYLYGFILIVIPLIFSIIISYKLVVKYVDQKTMAYLLATPNSRVQMIRTQIYVHIVCTLLLLLYATVLIFVLSCIWFPGGLVAADFISLNIGLISIHLFISSILFFCSSYFNESKHTIAIGSAIVIISILVQMLSQVSDQFSFLNYFTLLYLFDAHSLIEGNVDAIVKVVICLLSAICIYGFSVRIFKQKDLPL